jgi:hypothetical protein
MNLFRSALRRASVKMSLKKLRKAQNLAIRGMGTADPARVKAVKPQTDEEAGPGSVKDWTEAMRIRAPKRITTFIRRKLRY